MISRDPVRGLGFSERVFRLLLHAFPSEFRKAYATDAVELFRDRYREEYRRGRNRGAMLFGMRSV